MSEYLHLVWPDYVLWQCQPFHTIFEAIRYRESTLRLMFRPGLLLRLVLISYRGLHRGRTRRGGGVSMTAWPHAELTVKEKAIILAENMLY